MRHVKHVGPPLVIPDRFPPEALEYCTYAALIGGSNARRLHGQRLQSDLHDSDARLIPKPRFNHAFPSIDLEAGILDRLDVLAFKVPVRPPFLF